MLHDSADELLFPRLTDQDVSGLLHHGARTALRAGAELFAEPQPPTAFYVVLSGSIRVTKHLDGQDRELAVHGPGEFTGDLSLVTGSTITATATAVQDSEVLRLSDTQFQGALAEHPALARAVFRALAGRAHELGAGLQQQAKLASLGAMSAGLAHELNNPAAAAQRAAADLQDALADLPTLTMHLLPSQAPAPKPTDGFTDSPNSMDPPVLDASPPNAVAALVSLLEHAAADAAVDAGAAVSTPDPLEQSERVEELTDWLDQHGVPEPWELAGPLTDAGLAPSDLTGLPAGPSLTAQLTWLARLLRAQALTAEIAGATGRLSQLVSAMRSYSQVDRAPTQAVDLTAGLQATLIVLGHKLRGGITVHRDLPADLPAVWGNAGELNQVWTNLIDNAVAAMAGHGTLTVTARPDGDGVQVEIADTGPGVPTELQDRIFDQFFTTKPVGQGTGLGLDITRRIVQQHHGRVQLSSHPGDTRFQVWLPLHPLPPSRPLPPPPPSRKD